MSRLTLSRRRLVTAGASFGGVLLSGCDRLSKAPSFRSLLASASGLTYRAQRLLQSGQPLAHEFPTADISPIFKVNGTIHPAGEAYAALVDGGFQTWRLAVGGLVQRPLSLSLTQLRTLPSRTQITRHDCVEGWSAIGQWAGVPLSSLLDVAGLKPNARYIVFHCADELAPGAPYYESIDLVDAFHPQTILAYDLNGAPLQIGHGAPLRLRVERQLGYKQAKYVMSIEAIESFDHLFGGRGGFWEDRGYEWYAGI
ncbi:MAG TPA: molybdopterin-binding protein [Caulobacteraceae bacterium]|nr:molybdopterin-binding protein [Caulobacteraceae bacterium]